MSRILMVYATKFGQTRKIADTISEELRAAGHSVDVVSSDLAPLEIRVEAYDGVIAGGPVYSWQFPRSLRRWVASQSTLLNRKPSAFFSVCLGVLQGSDQKAKAEEEKIVDDFFQSTGWRPAMHTLFAGALHYTRYGRITRWIMRNIAKRAGGDTDTSRDYEYTRWEDVRDFARRVGSEIESRKLREVG